MSTTRNRPRRTPQPVQRSHGRSRIEDFPRQTEQQIRELRKLLRAPAGTSLLLFLGVVVLGAMGIVRVHSSTRVLEVGGEITTLTQEQARLLERKRRISAERAYLRHPDQIKDVARDRLGMVPMAPELVQHIRIEDNTL